MCSASRLQEEVEGVVHRHLYQVHRDLELARLLGEYQPRLVVGKRVLLPVDEVLRGLDFERVRNHIAAMGREPQSDGLRPEADQPVTIMGDVVERGVNRHMLAVLASLSHRGKNSL